MMFKQTLMVAISVVLAVNARKPCCGPEEFMAGNGATVGQVTPEAGPQGIAAYQYGAFNFKKRMFGYNMSVTSNGTTSHLRMIQNYATGYQYTILDEFQYCLMQKVTEPEPTNCIPENATLLSSFRIGDSKGNDLFADSWSYRFVHPKDAVQGDIVASFFQSDCSPFGTSFIGNRFQGNDTIPLIAMSGLLNLTLGIPHPAEWFTVPSFCPQEMNAIGIREVRSVPNLPNLDFLQLPTFY